VASSRPFGLAHRVAQRLQPGRIMALASLAAAPPTALLEVTDLSVKFPGRGGVVEAVGGISFTLAPGRVVCLLGESGSGKSVTLRAIVRLNHGARTTGRVVLAGRNVLEMSRRESRDSAGRAAMVFQEPMTALDPVYTIGAQIEETVRRHRRVSRGDARRRALELLELVQIPSPARCLAAYPHELSGGMRQRVMIAIALACDPALLLADEPTTALDVTVQAQILWLLRDLQRHLGLGLIIVTHDLGVAAEIADDALVMYAGRIVEQTTVGRLFSQPVHPYTRGLMAATVRRGQRGRALVAIPGAPPNLAALPPGCAFAPRCELAISECHSSRPDLLELENDHFARCPVALSHGAPVATAATG
jgi:peptide/nickel transport system ATP-binding protein